MPKKSKNRKPLNSSSALLLSFIILCIVIGAIFIKSSIISQNERAGILELRSDMIKTQTKFNLLDTGWEYDEYCRGYGTDVARNNAITCYIEIENSNISGDIISSFNSYTNLLFATDSFAKIREKEVVQSQNRPDLVNYAIKLSYNKYAPVSCELRTQAFTDKESRGILFICSFDSSTYTFEQR